MITRITERAAIRRLLDRDRIWALYALADLDDGLFEDCQWWVCGEALALVFEGISIRPIFVMGEGAELRELLGRMPADWGYLNLRTEQLAEAPGLWSYQEQHVMHRMVIEDWRPRTGDCVVLGPEHESEIRQLYETGDGGGVAFAPYQLATGFFRGVRRDGALVAVGGVHVVSRAESVGGVGNIFTRPDCRGQGLAQVAASAVVEALRAEGIRTIGLNVESTNAPAIAAYERLGFQARFTYVEGPARRITGRAIS
ncbi:MAG: GNAT family N-acetyltransferase [Acidobacteria bacterium]|nr:GNAT family N-acetyltransferase [Acidobacteriota bacterium]